MFSAVFSLNLAKGQLICGLAIDLDRRNADLVIFELLEMSRDVIFVLKSGR